MFFGVLPLLTGLLATFLQTVLGCQPVGGSFPICPFGLGDLVGTLFYSHWLIFVTFPIGLGVVIIGIIYSLFDNKKKTDEITVGSSDNKGARYKLFSAVGDFLLILIIGLFALVVISFGF